MSVRAAARALGMAHTGALYRHVRAGSVRARRRSPGGSLYVVLEELAQDLAKLRCECCGGPLPPTNWRFCSRSCSTAWRWADGGVGGFGRGPG
jgi:hypothetical protein